MCSCLLSGVVSEVFDAECNVPVHGVWVGITFLSSLYELACCAHVFPCSFQYMCVSDCSSFSADIGRVHRVSSE